MRVLSKKIMKCCHKKLPEFHHEPSAASIEKYFIQNYNKQEVLPIWMEENLNILPNICNAIIWITKQPLVEFLFVIVCVCGIEWIRLWFQQKRRWNYWFFILMFFGAECVCTNAKQCQQHLFKCLETAASLLTNEQISCRLLTTI